MRELLRGAAGLAVGLVLGAHGCSEEGGAGEGSSSGGTASDAASTALASSSGEVVAASGCPVQVMEGTIEVTTPAGLADLEGVTRIVGDLDVTGESIVSLAPLACLVEVTGRFAVSRTGVADLSGLEFLSRARDVTLADNQSLVSLDASGLQDVDSVLTLFGNPALAIATLPRLRSAGALSIGQCIGEGGVGNGITAIELPSITDGEGVPLMNVSANGQLESIESLVPVGEAIGFLLLQNNPALDGPQARAAWADAGHGAGTIGNCGNLNDESPCSCPAS